MRGVLKKVACQASLHHHPNEPSVQEHLARQPHSLVEDFHREQLLGEGQQDLPESHDKEGAAQSFFVPQKVMILL